MSKAVKKGKQNESDGMICDACVCEYGLFF